MSIQTKEKLESYKLDHKIIKSISTERLKTYIETVKKIKRNFHSIEYSSFEYNESDYINFSDKDNSLFIAIKKYFHFLILELKSRPDYQSVVDKSKDKIENKKERRNNKGCQKLSRLDRRKNRKKLNNKK